MITLGNAKEPWRNLNLIIFFSPLQFLTQIHGKFEEYNAGPILRWEGVAITVRSTACSQSFTCCSLQDSPHNFQGQSTFNKMPFPPAPDFFMGHTSFPVVESQLILSPSLFIFPPLPQCSSQGQTLIYTNPLRDCSSENTLWSISIKHTHFLGGSTQVILVKVSCLQRTGILSFVQLSILSLSIL